MKPLVMVVAMAKNRVIGKDGGLPWHIPEDLKHFRRVTLGHAVIMGRLTAESIGRPLKDRRNIVVTRRDVPPFEGCEIAGGLEAALAAARTSDDAPRVIGGGQLYTEALPQATMLFVTEVQQDVEGDTYFPELQPGAWEETESHAGNGVIYRTLVRSGLR